MGETDKTLTLRPLGIGELFDRAITLLVLYYVAFGAIALAGVLPGVLFDYLGTSTASPRSTSAERSLGVVPSNAPRGIFPSCSQPQAPLIPT